MKILLTNDDGLGSPALIPTIRLLERIGEVTAIVPRFQQSWTSKSNTRRAEVITKETHWIENKQITTLEALPADCANYGIYQDHTNLPDLVVSGANIGHNVGLSAFFSSGTIGAALEGLFANIPSIAISVPYPSNAELIAKPFIEAIQGMDRFISTFYHNRPASWGLVVLNLPYGKSIKQLHATHIGDYPYGRLFLDNDESSITPATYYDLEYPPIEEAVEGTDVWARYREHGSVVVMSFQGKFIPRDTVQSWLESNDLTTLGDDAE